MTKDKLQNLSEVIEEDYCVLTSKYVGQYTKTTLFLLPMLGLTVRDSLISKYLKNTFLNDEGIEHDFNKCLFLLFKVKSFKEKDWISMCDAFRNKKPFYDLYLMDYVVGTENGFNLVMFVFKVPEIWIPDYTQFIASRYSKFSDAYKERFPEFIKDSTGKNTESIVYGAIHKTDTLKDRVTNEFCVDSLDKRAFRRDMDSWMEIWSGVSMFQECYRIKNELL